MWISIHHTDCVRDKAIFIFRACILISLFLWFSASQQLSLTTASRRSLKWASRSSPSASPFSPLKRRSTRPSLTEAAARLARKVTFRNSCSSGAVLATRARMVAPGGHRARSRGRMLSSLQVRFTRRREDWYRMSSEALSLDCGVRRFSRRLGRRGWR